jgi:PAS domain S-box-containing protein
MSDSLFESVLLVDDTEENRYTFKRYLEHEGFTVWEAATGAEALELIAKKPSVVILDIRLPDMTGFEVCERLRANPRTVSIPVIHTSANRIEVKDRVQGLRGGADAYLVQPVDPAELLATIRALLRVRKAEAAARALANQWQTTFRAITDGVCLLDRELRIERSNPEFQRIFAVGEKELEGVSLPTLLAADLLEGDLAAIKGTRMIMVEFARGGRDYRLTTNPVLEEGRLEHVVCVFADITAQRQAERSMRSLNQDLEQRVKDRTISLEDANKQLESFSYSIAHDLRAPLRAIQGFSDILLEDYAPNLDEDGQSFLRRIRDGAKRMDTLIQDLLNYSRISRAELKIEPVNLRAVVESAMTENHSLIEERRARITVEVPAGLQVQAHEPALRQAIWNLLENATKFVAEQTDPKVRIFTETERNRVRLVVEDNGIGIAAEHRDRIFRIFERINVREYAGTGIGLAIVRRAMERMNGSVNFSSEPGQGSRFWLELALAG